MKLAGRVPFIAAAMPAQTQDQSSFRRRIRAFLGRVAVKEISVAVREQGNAGSDIACQVECIAQMAPENSSAVEQTQDSATTL
jgi:hypothetical protein